MALLSTIAAGMERTQCESVKEWEFTKTGPKESAISLVLHIHLTSHPVAGEAWERSSWHCISFEGRLIFTSLFRAFQPRVSRTHLPVPGGLLPT